MLVLTRREGRFILIGEGLKITVVEIGVDVVNLRVDFFLQDQSFFIQFWAAQDEKVQLGQEVSLMITEIGASVRIGITADERIPIVRDDLIEGDDSSPSETPA